MQHRLLGAGGVCRHQNVLRPSQCSTSSAAAGSAAAAGVASAAAGARRPRIVAQAAAQDLPAANSAEGGRRKQQRAKKWTYKYAHQAGPSPCARGDELCLQVEALVQNVLSYPTLPARICRCLPAVARDARIESMTALVEALAGHFGKELTLLYLRKAPWLLTLDFDTVLARIASFRGLFGVLDSDVPLLLRKCPYLLLIQPDELRARYDNLARATLFSPQQVRALLVKFPLVMCMNPLHTRGAVERLRQLCYTRDEWARDIETISPSLMAYFLRDSTDQLMRLEYLASTGERPEWQLREVMKPANRSFRAKLRNYAAWETRVKQRRAQQRAAAAAARTQAEQQARAAAIKAEILAEVGEATEAVELQQQQPQQPLAEPGQQQPGSQPQP